MRETSWNVKGNISLQTCYTLGCYSRDSNQQKLCMQEVRVWVLSISSVNVPHTNMVAKSYIRIQ